MSQVYSYVIQRKELVQIVGRRWQWSIARATSSCSTFSTTSRGVRNIFYSTSIFFMIYVLIRVIKSRGFELMPSKVVLDVSRNSYRGRMQACWPKWDSIPPHIIECIWQDVIVSLFLVFQC